MENDDFRDFPAFHPVEYTGIRVFPVDGVGSGVLKTGEDISISITMYGSQETSLAERREGRTKGIFLSMSTMTSTA